MKRKLFYFDIIDRKTGKKVEPIQKGWFEDEVQAIDLLTKNYPWAIIDLKEK